MIHCISAKDVDCLSNTTYARDAKGKILYDSNGKPRIDPNAGRAPSASTPSGLLMEPRAKAAA